VESFRWIAVAVSMILGIGVTRLLSSAVMIVRNRSEFRLDILPVAWAAFVFVAQIQFWWAIIELSKVVKIWTLASFVALLSMPLLLFVAAALILPHEPRPRDLELREGFRRDGRWALAALALYNTVASVVDAVWWSTDLMTVQGAMLIGLVILPACALYSSRRVVQLSITAAYALLLIVADIQVSPGSYG
jgi:hypothetical protein